MLGTILGDIVGSPYEFRNHRSKAFQPLFHPRARFTDDTVCTIGVADALLSGGDPTRVLQTWCLRYESNGGWGQRFSLWITADDPRPYGSLGNGGAMRVSPAGLLAHSVDDALTLATRVTEITHDHPDGLQAACAVAAAIRWAREGLSGPRIRELVEAHFGYDLAADVATIRPGYQRTEAAAGSVPQAITCALEATDFEDALRNAVSIGGDSDTIAAIAGGIAEARFGIPPDIATTGWGLLPADMREVLKRLYAAAGATLPTLKGASA
jgi:ADP-ribosylglycohydrolase